MSSNFKLYCSLSQKVRILFVSEVNRAISTSNYIPKFFTVDNKKNNAIKNHSKPFDIVKFCKTVNRYPLSYLMVRSKNK